jgi:hypothetical protein
MNANGHEFWWLMTGACVLWYTVITGYVAVKGVLDIKHMLNRLSGKSSEPESPAL